jgi:hypothetical protein
MTIGSVARPAGHALLALLSCCFVLVPTASRASDDGFIDPCTSCSLPAVIPLVGMGANGLPDPLGAFTVTVRDASNNPWPGATVTIDFSNCGEINLCPSCCGASCSPRQSVSAITNLMGQATFDLVGARSTRGPVGAPGCAVIWVEGNPCPRSVVAYDLDGIHGVTPLDLSLAAADVFAGTNLPRSDYDGNGIVNPLDLSMSYRLVLAGGSTSSCPTSYCP